MKILVILIALAAIFWAWRTLSGSRQRVQPGRSAKEKDMVACAHCGLHIPRDEAIVREQQSYCCAEHSRLGAEKQ